MTGEEIESVLQDIEINRGQGIPFKQWTLQEKMVDAYYNTGGSCPSTGLGGGVNLKPEMERRSIMLDTQETEQGKILSGLLEELAEND